MLSAFKLILPWRHLWSWTPQSSRKCHTEIRFIKVKKLLLEIRCTIVNIIITYLGLQHSPISCLLIKTSGLDSSCIYLTQKCLDSRAWRDQESVSPCPKAFWIMWDAVSGKAILKGKRIMSSLTEKYLEYHPHACARHFKLFVIERFLLPGSA